MLQLLKNYKQNDLAYSIGMQCAPLICGVKISNLLIIENKELENINQIFKNSFININRLYSDENKSILLLYNYKELEGYLHEESIPQFMKAQGYHSLEVEDVLEKIARRFQGFKANKDNKVNKDWEVVKEEFPHELGIILGYPVWDVMGFIENGGKNSLYTGYWKVYKNLDQANETFSKYEMAKALVMKNVIEGSPFYSSTLPQYLR